MSERMLDLDRYFERIGYSGSPSVTPETLYQLHLAHTTTVPFENLDVFYGKPILLDEASLVKKLVEDRRGGYCFEMNGIFALVLQKLGFKVTNLLARGTMDGINYSAKTHQALLVEMDGSSWLADVGYGNEGIMAPLLMEENTDQTQFAHTYRLIANPTFGYTLEKKLENGEYEIRYVFGLTACYPIDFEMSNHFTSTFRESFFTMMRMCTMPTKTGRVTLTDQHYKVVENGVTTERELKDEAEFQSILKEQFRLDLDAIKKGAESVSVKN